MAYPVDIYSQVNVAGTTLLADDDHSARHNAIGTDVAAIEAVIGTNAGTSVLKNFSAGDFAARVNNETLGTPTIIGANITGGTISNVTGVNSAYLTVGTANADYICDGTADNVQIQAAIDAATTNGGIVFIKEGTYNISGVLIIKDGVHVQGAGIGATILKASTALGGIFYNSSTTTTYTDIAITDMTLDADNQTTTSCIQVLKFVRLRVENLLIKNCTNIWALRVGETVTDEDTSKSTNYIARNIYIDGCTSTGLEQMIVVNTNYFLLDTIVFTNNDNSTNANLSIYSFSRYGDIRNTVYIDSTSPFAQIQVVGCSDITIRNQYVNITSGNNGRAVWISSCKNVDVIDCNWQYTDTLSGIGVYVLDLNSTIDGHTNPYPDSSYLTLQNNKMINGYSLYQSGYIGTGNFCAQTNVSIVNNQAEQIYNGVIIAGSANITGTINNYIIANNIFKMKGTTNTTGIFAEGNGTYPLYNFNIQNNQVLFSGTSGINYGIQSDYMGTSIITGNILYPTGSGTAYSISHGTGNTIANNILT